MAIDAHVPFYFSSEDAGAPQASDAAGAMLGILAACLTTGFNLKTVSDLTVASGVATLTCNNHGFTSTRGKIIEIKGATPAALNGTWQPTYHDTNTLKFNCPSVADGTASGSITVQRAALGWQQKFTDGNKCIFKRSNPQASAMELYIDDSNVSPARNYYALVQMLEGSNDINTHIDATPRVAWRKRGGGYAVGEKWVVLGNAHSFYYMCAEGSVEGYGKNYFFGDILTENTADACACWLVGSLESTSWVGQGFHTSAVAGSWGSAAKGYFARGKNQVTKAVEACTQGLASGNLGYAGYTAAAGELVRMSWPVYIKEKSSALNHPLRGIAPGLLEPLCVRPYAQNAIVEQVGPPTRALLALRTRQGGSERGSVAFDLTGDLWQLA